LGAPTLDAAGALSGLVALGDRLGAPRALRDLGMPESGIAPAADAVLAAVPPGNPAFVDLDRLVALVGAAWQGEEPR
ncbi:MAG: maleylacetate reductase, partial [Microbacterium sp.]